MVRLREARIRRMLSLRALAGRAGVSLNTVHFAETGRQVPYLSTMAKIAAALEVAPAEIDEFRQAMEAAVGGESTGGREGC